MCSLIYEITLLNEYEWICFVQNFGSREARRRVQPGGLQPRLHPQEVRRSSGIRSGIIFFEYNGTSTTEMFY